MRSVRAAGGVVHEERLVRSEFVDLMQVGDGVIRHVGGQVVTWFANVGVNPCGVAIQIGLPLICFAAQESVEIFETQSDGPLIERTHLTCFVGRCVVLFAEPGGCVAILF